MKSKSVVKRMTVQSPSKTFEILVDELIEAARTRQEEGHGPDMDYRIAAQKDLDDARKKLVNWFEQQTRK